MIETRGRPRLYCPLCRHKISKELALGLKVLISPVRHNRSSPKRNRRPKEHSNRRP